MLYSCTHMATVGVKGLIVEMHALPDNPIVYVFSELNWVA